MKNNPELLSLQTNIDDEDQFEAVLQEFIDLHNKHCAYPHLIAVIQNLLITMTLTRFKGNKDETAYALEHYLVPDLLKDIAQLKQEHIIESMPTTDITKAH